MAEAYRITIFRNEQRMRWEAKSHYDDRMVLKDAGWRWKDNPNIAVWSTRDIGQACLLYWYADAATRPALEEEYLKRYHEPAPKPEEMLDLSEPEEKSVGDLKVSRPVVKIKDGTYTVDFGGDHRTLRIRTYTEGNFAGKRIISYLAGPDNESDYQGFAFLNDDNRVFIWRRFQGQDNLLTAALQVLADPDNAGLAYAMESGRCYRCGRTLTVPASLHRGLGPVCAGVV